MSRFVVVICDEDSNCFGYVELFCSLLLDNNESNLPIMIELNGKILNFDKLLYYQRYGEIVRSCKLLVKNIEEAEKEMEKISRDMLCANIHKSGHIETTKTAIYEAGQKLYDAIPQTYNANVFVGKNTLLLLVNSDVESDYIKNNILSNGKYLDYDVEIEVGYSFFAGSNNGKQLS